LVGTFDIVGTNEVVGKLDIVGVVEAEGGFDTFTDTVGDDGDGEKEATGIGDGDMTPLFVPSFIMVGCHDHNAVG